MIDLSHLSEEEQANILKVLQRDTELRKVEESRVRQLQIKNEIQRKNMTGEWFYKAKAKRHRDTLHGAELIQASMRKKKPMTIYDRLQSMELKEKSNSLLKNAGNGIFIPPELTFFLQAPKVEEPRASTTLRKENRAHPQQQQMPRKTNSSSAKQRENPFNKSSLSADYPNEERLPLPDGNQSPTIQDKRILHTDFESPQVSDQQFPEIFQGKQVNFAVPLSKTAPAEQRLKARSSKSQVHNKYATEHIKATDESISKVLDWFIRSDETPTVRVEEMKSPTEATAENISEPLKSVLPKPDEEFTHTESASFTEESKSLPYLNDKIQEKEEQEIQLLDAQNPIKNNISDKYTIPEAALLEEESKTRTKDVSELTYPDYSIFDHFSNDKQQDLNQEQNEESAQRTLILKPFTEKWTVGIKENIGGESESTESTSKDIDIVPIDNIENYSQESKSRPEQTEFTIEELKTVPLIDNKDEKKDILYTDQISSPKDKTSAQKNAFANAVFGKSSKGEKIDMYSVIDRSALLESKGNNNSETMINNGVVQQLDHNKNTEEQSNLELEQHQIHGSEKEQMAIKCEEPFLENAMQKQNQAENSPAYRAVSTESTAPYKIEPTSFSKQNVEKNNTSEWNSNVPEVKQTLRKEDKSEANLYLKGNDTNIISEEGKPFTIISINKRIYETSDNPPFNNTQFVNLMNFWDKGTKSDTDNNDDQSKFTQISDDKHLSTQVAMKTEPEIPLDPEFLMTQRSNPVQRITQPSDFDTPEQPTEIKHAKPQLYSGPSVQEIMHQLRHQSETESPKKKLDTKYFPKVLPTEPNLIQVKLKKAPDFSNEDGFSPTSSIFQKHSLDIEEEPEESTVCQPKLRKLNTSYIGLQKLHQDKDEGVALTDEDLNKDEEALPSSFMLRDNESIDGQNIFNLIRNNNEEYIPEKRMGNVESLDNRVQITPKSIGIPYQDEKIPIRQTSSDAVNNNEENLTLFAGGSRLIEENDISQEKLDRFELSDSPIQTFLNPTDTSLQEEEISLIKSDKEAIYDEVPGVDLNENKRDFELHDEFEPKLNLQSGITRTSTFKESEDGSTEMPTEIHKSEMPYDSEQEAKHISSNHWGGNDQMHVESRGSLSEDEMPTMSWKMNPHASDTYKSLQDLNAIDSMPSTLDLKKKEMILSAHDVSAIPVSPENTPLQSKKMKRLSQSVPALAENDDADSRSERSFQMNKHGTIASSLTNISSSSGMTSRSSVGSIMSIYSDDFGNIDVRGKIQFSLDYVDKLKEFHIFVVRCSDLAAADEKKNRSDPYVKSYLLPDKVKMGKKKTTVMKKTLNPIYNEILRYKVEKDVLMAQTLNLSVWHNDTFGRNNFLGEIDVELEKWNWTNKQMEWYNLKPRAISAYTMGNRGTLKVALRYIPKGQRGKKTGEVQIWVKEANNLPQVRVHRLDPFVKCFILPDTSRKSRQKSRVVKKNRNPNFNHTMVYDGFGPEDLKEACVELSVWDHDKLVNHFLGGLRIGLGTGKSYGMAVDWMDSTEEEKIIWNKMITNPNIWVEDVLPLRMLMLSKTVTN
ncbi:synaptotagmin-like protein 2 isoform X3 [Amblyraja radiata]|uniref:synaptotagmin-like protein 2 isoform X3 n=1 Tax=Amblyraja radiata TaxID=386614 RepID=UPI001403FD96|nr:synaptotagmin-like protein 2 isoform X3 [Amblyraja radiata]